MTVDVAKIEEKIDKVEAGKTLVSMELGGVRFQSMLELMEFAKLMAISGSAVPPHLRGNAGGCLAQCTKALRFGFDPFSLAEHSFAMVKKQQIDGRWEEIETIAYDSFVIAAIIEAHAPIEGRLRIEFEGEGDNRRCTVSAIPRGEKTPLKLTSPTLGERKAAIGKNDKGNLKGSPLWLTKPDQQLAYDTRRDFCRRHFPETLLGWYDKDEMAEHGFDPADRAKDITPSKPRIAERLKKDKGDGGFRADNVDTATSSAQNPDPNAVGEQDGTGASQAVQAEPEAPASQSDEPAEPSPADAFELGRATRKAGGMAASWPGTWKRKTHEPLIAAFTEGWKAEDAELTAAKKAAQ